MAVPANVMRYVFAGSLLNGEKWQTGIWFQGNLPTSNGSAATAAELEMTSQAGATPSSFWNVLKAFMPAGVTLDFVKVYAYPTGGTAATFVGQSVHAPIPGTAANVAMPNQVALCTSLLTGVSGRSFRGRMYWPASAAAGLWSQVSALFIVAGLTSFTTALAQMITDFNAVGQVGVVVSQTRTLATPITTVRADTRADIQRRRARSESGITSVVRAV